MRRVTVMSQMHSAQAVVVALIFTTSASCTKTVGQQPQSAKTDQGTAPTNQRPNSLVDAPLREDIGARALEAVGNTRNPPEDTDGKTVAQEDGHQTPSNTIQHLNKQQVHRALRTTMKEQRYCIEEKMRRCPSGKIVTEFTILPDGTVDNIRVVTNTQQDRAYENCIVGALQKTHFPKASKKTKVSYPWHVNCAD